MKVWEVAVVLGFVLALFAVVGAFCWPYTVNTWLAYAESSNRMLWWHGALMGLVPGVGQACIPAAVVTWIAMLFLS